MKTIYCQECGEEGHWVDFGDAYENAKFRLCNACEDGEGESE